MTKEICIATFKHKMQFDMLHKEIKKTVKAIIGIRIK